MNFFGRGPSAWGDRAKEESLRPLATVSTRTLGKVIEDALMDTLTRKALEVVLAEEPDLTWTLGDVEPTDVNLSKRALIDGYIDGWSVPQLANFARRLEKDVEPSGAWITEIGRYLDAYERGGGVTGPTKNLIFAATGPKPEIVLRDAVSNDIEIVANAEYCLVYDQPVPPEGLRFNRLVQWWREQNDIPSMVDDRDVGLQLHRRLLDTLVNRPGFGGGSQSMEDESRGSTQEVPRRAA